MKDGLLASLGRPHVVFQAVTLPLVAWFLLRSAWRLRRRQRPRWVGFAGLVLWSAAALAIVRPQLTNEAARLLGIGRGADLVLYAVAIAFMAACFYFYQKTRRLEGDLTRMVRHLAIREELERTDRPTRAAASRPADDQG